MEFPQEFLHSYMFRGKYLLRGTFYCNEAIIHENDPVRNIFGKIHLVGDDYHSDVFGCQILSSGSRADVGSSKNRISGFIHKALAMETLCCCPPESW